MDILVFAAGLFSGVVLFIILTTVDGIVSRIIGRTLFLTPYKLILTYCLVVTLLLCFYASRENQTTWAVLLLFAAFLLSGILLSAGYGKIREKLPSSKEPPVDP